MQCDAFCFKDTSLPALRIYTVCVSVSDLLLFGTRYVVLLRLLLLFSVLSTISRLKCL